MKQANVLKCFNRRIDKLISITVEHYKLNSYPLQKRKRENILNYTLLADKSKFNK